MKQINGCREAEKIRKDGRFEMHLADCPDCLEAQKVADWMQKFATQTPMSQNLRTPGFLMLKARLSRRQADAGRAIQPIMWMQAASILMFVLGIVWLEIKIDAPIFSTLNATFSLLATIVPSFTLALAIASLICFGLAYKMRGRKN